MGKRILSVLLALCIALSLLPGTALAEGETAETRLYESREPYAVEGGNLYFDPGSGAIVDCDTSVTRADIPSQINGVGVKSIGASAFWDCGGLTGVTIPSSVTSIEYAAFYGCSGLTGVTIPDRVTNIGESAFAYCLNLTSFIIPNSVTRIGRYAFSGCEGLISITIPNSVISIGEGVFCLCSKLTSIEVDAGNPNYISENGILFTKDRKSLIAYPYLYAGQKAYAIPNSVTSIGKGVFNLCGLTSVTISNNVTRIETNAFANCFELKDVYYSGSETDWQAVFKANGNEQLINATIHYNSGGGSGGATPTPPPTSSAQNGVSSEISRLYITSASPNHSCVSLDGIRLSFTFNANVVKKSGQIKILRDTGGGRSDVMGIPVSGPDVTVDGNRVSVNLPNTDALEGGGHYCVTIDSGSFASTDGHLFYGISDPAQWEFQIENTPAPTNVTLKWEKSFWKRDDYSKPPVPAGTDDEYAWLLSGWSNGGLSRDEALEMLDQPVYLPVTDKNGSPVLLSDKATTVRQVVEDLVFLEKLQPYVREINRDLREIKNFTKGLHPNSMWQERDIYNKVIGWYPQINRFMKSRHEESNFFYASAAPLAYQAMQTALEKTGSLSTVLKADLDDKLAEASLKGLQSYADYTEFKQKAEDIKWFYSGGKTIYTAVTDRGKGVVSFGVDLLEKFLEDAGTLGDSEFLTDLSEAWSTLKDVKSAVSTSLTMGSSIGLFPLLMDFSNKSFTKIKESTLAFYFIGDYYIHDKYPKIYDVVYDDQTCMPEKNLLELELQASEEYAHRNDDPVLFNWLYYLGPVTEHVNRDKCKTMRYDLVNYILLLRYAGSANVLMREKALVNYLISERDKQATTGISVSCPVTIKLYDQSGNLAATLSSNDETIQNCDYGTLYLLGENNETKYFLLNSSEYRVEIEPYPDSSMENTMDILITNVEADGSQSSVYYEDVSLEGVSSISTATGGDSLLVTGADGVSSVAPKESIPAAKMLLTAPEEMAVGESARADVQIYPSAATDQTVEWQCSSANAAVSSDGTIQALSEGEAVITAYSKDGLVSASAAVNIYTPATGITVSTNAIQLKAGDEYTLTAQATGSPGRAVSWHSNDMGIATVDEAGVVRGVSNGTTTLIAEIDNQTAEVAVTVRDYPVNVSLYQSDVEKMRLKVDLSNTSSVSEFSGSIYAVIYRNGQMVDAWQVCSALSEGESVTSYHPLVGLQTGQQYMAAAFVLDENGTPQQVKTEAIVWSDG